MLDDDYHWAVLPCGTKVFAPLVMNGGTGVYCPHHDEIHPIQQILRQRPVWEADLSHEPIEWW